MFGIPVVGLVLRLLGHRTERRADELRLRRELLAHQRRQLIHARIPDVDTVRASFGPRFEELQRLLETYDVAGVGAGNAYYPELTRTVIFQLHKVGNEPELLQLLEQEQGLWFGSGNLDQQQLNALVQAVRAWQIAANF